MGDDKNVERVRVRQKGRGRHAQWPHRIPARGWWDIAKRVGAEVIEDRVGLVAAGGDLLSDPRTVSRPCGFRLDLRPRRRSGDDRRPYRGYRQRHAAAAAQSDLRPVERLAKANSNALSFGFIFGLLAALWSANNGIKTIFEALNIAYEEREGRSFVRLNLLSLVFTLGAMLIAALLVVAVGVVPAVSSSLQLRRRPGRSGPLSALARAPPRRSAVGIGVIYRFGPSRSRARWRWLVPGAVLAAVVWLVASIGFSWYLQNFANYNATYGSLGAVIGFLMWVWISMVILLVGAEFNSEMEHQTAMDSTEGKEAPMGARGAVMADTLGSAATEE